MAPSSSSTAGRTFPPSQVPIEPGTYHWSEFEPAIAFDVGPGWEIGHRHPEFFDLFRGSDFPSVSFGRFTDVFIDKTTVVAATDAATVAASLGAWSAVTVSAQRSVELGGLRGQQFDLTVAGPQTPVFRGPGGDFHLDAEYVTRYRVLDLPEGGVLIVGVHARAGGIDAAATLADPIIASFEVEP